MFSAFSQLNYSLFTELNSHAGAIPWLDTLMVFCSELLIFCWPLLLVLAWGIPLSWRKGPLPEAEVVRLQDRRAAIIWIAGACLLAYGFNLLIEQVVYEPRPFISHHVHLLVQHVADSSFPSDHTAWSFAVVGMLAFSLLPWFSSTRLKLTMNGSSPIWRTSLIFLLLALLIACTIGVARIFVGVHYPGDIAGGAFDGLLAAFVVTLTRSWLNRPTQAVIHLAQRLRLA